MSFTKQENIVKTLLNARCFNLQNYYQNNINLGMDWTFNFEWLNKDWPDNGGGNTTTNLS